MFARKSCYFFVRPKKSFLEVCVFLGRAVKAPQVRRVDRASKSKVAHVIRIRHRDEVEAPITDWLQEAYDYSGAAARAGATAGITKKTKTARKPAKSKAKPRERRKRSTQHKHGLDVDDRRSVDGFHRTDAQTSTVDLANGHGMKAKRVGPVR